MSRIANGFLLLLLVFALPSFAAEKKPAAGPGVRSAAALVVDGKTGEVIFEQKAGLVAPIASITKLMTALVVLDAQLPLDEKVEITKADVWKGKGAHSRLAVGTKLTRGDLLRLALMASENRAAHTLARTYPGGTAQFVKTMNMKAKVLGMTQTRFADASGLSSLNVSSARDLAKLVHAAARDATVKDYSTLDVLDVRVGKFMLRYVNTNLLVGRPDWEILVQKTGFTQDAGECLVMQALIEDRPVTMILLNSFGKLTRTADARRIRKWLAAREPKLDSVAGASNQPSATK
jgi:D-alanyl-D-alanine endopeptidase (penicillin-binding protein 7)